jgi:hypothetical protein
MEMSSKDFFRYARYTRHSQDNFEDHETTADDIHSFVCAKKINNKLMTMKNGNKEESERASSEETGLTTLFSIAMAKH